MTFVESNCFLASPSNRYAFSDESLMDLQIPASLPQSPEHSFCDMERNENESDYNCDIEED